MTRPDAETKAITGLPRGWPSLHLRFIAAANAIFLITMTVFLTVSFSMERKLALSEIFEHLEETAGLLGAWPGALDATEIAHIEDRLSHRTGAQHRLLVVDARGRVLTASDRVMIGTRLQEQFSSQAIGTGDGGQALVSGTLGPWHAVSVPRKDEPGDRSVYLLRADSGSEAFTKAFLRLHGVHVLVTIALFTSLLQLVGARYIRRPIERLADAIERLEEGNPVIEPSSKHPDELGWLEVRFGRMAERLRETVRRLVRAEKGASAYAVAIRVVHELEDPLRSLGRHTAYLEALAGRDPQLQKVKEQIREDQRKVLSAVRRLAKIDSLPEERSD